MLAFLCTFVFITAALAFIYLYSTWNFDYWNKRNVIYEKPVPFFGSFSFLKDKSTSEYFRDIYQKFPNADYIGIWLFRTPGLVIRSPELSKRILVKDFEAFRNRYIASTNRNDRLGSLNIFAVDDPVWSSIRRRLTSVFTSAKLRNLFPLTSKCANEMVENIREKFLNRDDVDVRDVYSMYTTDVIGSSAFGVAPESFKDPTGAPLRILTRHLMEYSLKRGVFFVSLFFYPDFANLIGSTFFPNVVTKLFRSIFWSIANDRMKNPKASNNDLLDALLRLRTDLQKDGIEVTDDLILAQAAIFLQGGFDTSAVALTYTTLELANHPDIQEHLYEEVFEANEKCSGVLDCQTINELPFLNMCIKETTRKYPAMGFIDRVAVRDYVVDDTLTIEKGTPLYVDAIGMHYDPEYFPEPYEYSPDRFSPENERNMTPMTFMPFGEGPRNCIGMRFGMQTMKVALCKIILNFKLEAVQGMAKPHEMGFEKKSIFLGPDRVIHVKFVERKI